MIHEMILDIGNIHLIRLMDTITVHHHIPLPMVIIPCHHLLFRMIHIDLLHLLTITLGHLHPITHLLIRSISLGPSLIRCHPPMVLHMVNTITRRVNASRCLLTGIRSLLLHIILISRMVTIDSQS
jgi:hypothetical protein